MKNFVEKLTDKVKSLSKRQLLIYSTLGILTASFSYFAKKSGLLRIVKVKETDLESQTIVYQQYQGDYKHISKLYQKVAQDCQIYFPNSKKYFGIYYDNPQQVQDVTQCRAVVGLIIEEQDKINIKDFLQNSVTYHRIQLPQVQSAQIDFPFHPYTFSIISWKVFAPLYRYAMIEKKSLYNEEAGCLGIYDGVSMIKYAIPLGENSKVYNLTNKDKPKMKF